MARKSQFVFLEYASHPSKVSNFKSFERMSDEELAETYEILKKKRASKQSLNRLLALNKFLLENDKMDLIK